MKVCSEAVYMGVDARLATEDPGGVLKYVEESEGAKRSRRIRLRLRSRSLVRNAG